MSTKTKNPPTIAGRIRAAIAESGLTRAEVASRAGLSLDAVYKLLAGKHEPGAETLAKLCRALEVSADELLGLP